MPNTSLSHESAGPARRPSATALRWTAAQANPRLIVALAILLIVGVIFARKVATQPSATGPVCQSRDAAPVAHVETGDVVTIEQAYNCVLVHYPTGATLDDRSLFRGAMAGLVRYLVRRGADQVDAVLPALSGDRSADWQAFKRAYAAIASSLARTPGLRQGLVAATISGMIDSLGDDHAHYLPRAEVAPPVDPSARASGRSLTYGLGVRLSSDVQSPGAVAAPLFLTAVDPGSPASRAGLRPGDIVTAVDGAPAVVDGRLVPGALSELRSRRFVTLTVLRPSDQGAWTVDLSARTFPTPPLVSARWLLGHIAYLHLAQFFPGATSQMLVALHGLGSHPRGLVLDLRGNGGGDAQEQARVMGLFVHGATIQYADNGHGRRTSQHSDDGVPLLHLPLVALVDGGCASACDVTAADIRDLQLGRLIGARTAGDVSGPAADWGLDDGSAIEMPGAFMRGPAGEVVDGIGVPPGQEAPVTAQALSSGKDPALVLALADLSAVREPRQAIRQGAPVPPNIRVTHDPFAAHAEPSLAVNPRNARNLLGTAQFSASTRQTARPASFVSFDGGRSWHDNGPLALPAGYVSGDDVSATFTAAGTGFIAGEVYGGAGGSAIVVWRTRDGGRRFESPRIVYRSPSQTTNTDHPSICASIGSPPYVYIAWSYGTHLLFSRSVDDGLNFNTARVISVPSDAHPDWAVATAGRSGAVHVAYYGGGTAPFEVVSSSDSGVHFGSPASPSILRTTAAQGTTLSTLLAAATDPRHGTLYVARAEPLGGHFQVLVWRSTDGGRRWSRPEPVTTGPADHFQPQAMVDAAGEVDVTYFTLAHGAVREAMATSSGHGTSFHHHRTVGTRSFDPGSGVQGKGATGVKGGSAGWIGDYQGLAAGHKDVYPLWNDGRSGHLEVYAAIIPTTPQK